MLERKFSVSFDSSKLTISPLGYINEHGSNDGNFIARTDMTLYDIVTDSEGHEIQRNKVESQITFSAYDPTKGDPYIHFESWSLRADRMVDAKLTFVEYFSDIPVLRYNQLLSEISNMVFSVIRVYVHTRLADPWLQKYTENGDKFPEYEGGLDGPTTQEIYRAIMQSPDIVSFICEITARFGERFFPETE